MGVCSAEGTLQLLQRCNSHVLNPNVILSTNMKVVCHTAMIILNNIYFEGVCCYSEVITYYISD